MSSLLQELELFFGADIYSALLVIGGAAMAFHFKLLHKHFGGVPITVAIGDPVSGKSTAVQSAMALFNQTDSIGGNASILCCF